MSNWVTISADNLKPYTLAAKLSALRTKALADGQADPFTEVMTDCVNKVRSAVKSGFKQVSATPLTVPPELKGETTLIIVEQLSLRLTMVLKLDEDLVRAIDRAHGEIRRVAEGKGALTMPDDPLVEDVQRTGGGVSVVTSCGPVASRSQTGGLL